jgi:hypothetical protein
LRAASSLRTDGVIVMDTWPTNGGAKGGRLWHRTDLGGSAIMGCRLLALRVTSRQCSISVALGAKRTLSALGSQNWIYEYTPVLIPHTAPHQEIFSEKFVAKNSRTKIGIQAHLLTKSQTTT